MKVYFSKNLLIQMNHLGYTRSGYEILRDIAANDLVEEPFESCIYPYGIEGTTKADMNVACFKNNIEGMIYLMTVLESEMYEQIEDTIEWVSYTEMKKYWRENNIQ